MTRIADRKREDALSGFTLVELLVALVLVSVVVGGIVAAFSTSLTTWRLAQKSADLAQEARTILGLVARDLRAASLGPADSPTGVFITEETGLRFTTSSAILNRLTYSTFEPTETASEYPVSDQADVKYFQLGGSDTLRAGFYRVERFLPPYDDYDVEEIFEPGERDLVSPNVSELNLRYFDGQAWSETWDTTQAEVAAHRLPWAVEVELHLRDPEKRDSEHVYHTIVPIALGHG